jgi:Bacterial translation initiation factor IF-2 associated region
VSGGRYKLGGGVEGVLVLVIGACLAVAVAAWLAHARSPGTVPVGGAAVPAAVARRTASFRLAGVIAGLAAGGAAAGQGPLGRGPLLAGPVFGLCVLAGVAAGEISVRPAGGRTRTAAVEVRRVRDYLPRGLAAAVTAAAAVLAALVAVTTVTAGPDDLGRAGRVLLLSCPAGLQQTYGPWPGSFYSVPLAAVVAAGLIAGGGALRVVIRRARTGADADAVAADDALRRRAARTITGACGILVALPLAGVCLVSASALLSVSCHPAWWTYAGWALLALLIPVVALMGWSAAVLLAPARAATAAPPAR